MQRTGSPNLKINPESTSHPGNSGAILHGSQGVPAPACIVMQTTRMYARDASSHFVRRGTVRPTLSTARRRCCVDSGPRQWGDDSALLSQVRLEGAARERAFLDQRSAARLRWMHARARLPRRGIRARSRHSKRSSDCALKVSSSGLRLALIAGMQVEAEIRAGGRSVLGYLLSPVRQVIRESAGER